ncbi:unnamed protein product [Nippostrongylus brasiliensis]|uniref:IntS14_C domain-containing protein n=1 Tax=Nippostrongylus brasiliensis TaxID=27835 RepID=A0A0N4YU25_NIPBR|nr:unnamed protein product [Nippostrongylus brasiliensis]
MVIYLVLDGHQPGLMAQQEEEKAARNTLYLQIVTEILQAIGNRSKELKVEVYWGNTCVSPASVVCDTVTSAVEKAIEYVSLLFMSSKGGLHLGRLFDSLRAKMKSDDAVVLLSDAAIFKADITSYPQGMMFAVIVDVITPNSTQLSELEEVTKTSNKEQRNRTRTVDWSACSPDCNPMKNMWRIVVRQVYADNKQFSSVEELKRAMMTVWDNISDDVIQDFVERCSDKGDQLQLVRTEEQDSADLLGTIGPALLETESVAIVLINESKYGCITAEKVGDDFCLIFSKFPEKMPEFVPDFSTLISGPEEQGDALHFTAVQGVAPSYGPVVQSWVREHGFNMDFQKMMRLLRKLPDRPHIFYQEVNRFRKYALAIGMDHVLHEAARIIREEIGPLNAMAQKHGAYVATAFVMENPRDTPEIAQL